MTPATPRRDGAPEGHVVKSDGYLTLTAALDDLTRRGFTEHFEVIGDRVRGAEGGRTFRPEELTIREFYRFEGVSDPDDMSIVYAIEGRDGTRGTLVDAFGVYSDPAVSTAIENIPIRRAT
jgi:hypothetical protein